MNEAPKKTLILISGNLPGSGSSTQAAESARSLQERYPLKKVERFSAGAIRRGLAALYTKKYNNNWKEFERIIALELKKGLQGLYQLLDEYIQKGCDEKTLAIFSQCQAEAQAAENDVERLVRWDALPDELAYFHIIQSEADYMIYEGKLATELFGLGTTSSEFAGTVLRVFLTVDERVSAVRVLEREIRKGSVSYEEIISSNMPQETTERFTAALSQLLAVIVTQNLSVDQILDNQEINTIFIGLQSTNPVFSSLNLKDIVEWLLKKINDYQALNKARIERDHVQYAALYGADKISGYQDRIARWKRDEPYETLEIEVGNQKIATITQALLGMISEPNE